MSSLGEAYELLSAEFEETVSVCRAIFYYGNALLEMARLEARLEFWVMGWMEVGFTVHFVG